MKHFLFALMTLALLPMSAHAVTASFTAADHPDAANNPPYSYGFRVDDINQHFTHSLGNSTIAYNTDAGTASITGTINLHLGAGGIDGTWNLDYQMSGVTAYGNGFRATGGSGSIWNDLSQYDFTGKQDGNGYAAIFKDDGFRLAGDNSSFVFRGWTMDAGQCGAFRAAGVTICNSNGSTTGTNDFLLTVQGGGIDVDPIPIPASGLLLLGGLSLFGLRRRK